MATEPRAERFSLSEARRLYRSGHVGPAVGHYLAVLPVLSGSKKQSLRDEFFTALFAFCHRLSENRKTAEALQYTKLGLGLFDGHDEGSNSVVAGYAPEAGGAPVEIDQWHWRMLNDWGRNAAYRQALERHKGSRHILDIGCGSGLLCQYAAEANPHAVITGCDTNARWTEIARRATGDNAQITIQQCSSHQVQLPEQLDLIITELMDAGGLGEGIATALLNILQRCSVEHPRRSLPSVIPRKISLYCVLVESSSVRNDHVILTEQGRAASTSYMTQCANDDVNRQITEPYDCYHLRLMQRKGHVKVLTKHARYLDLNLNVIKELRQVVEEGVSGSVSLAVERAGRPDAIAVYWRANLTDDITLSSWNADTRLSDLWWQPPQVSNSWDQAVFPLAAKPDALLEPGTIVGVGFRVGPSEDGYQRLALEQPTVLVERCQVNPFCLLDEARIFNCPELCQLYSSILSRKSAVEVLSGPLSVLRRSALESHSKTLLSNFEASTAIFLPFHLSGELDYTGIIDAIGFRVQHENSIVFPSKIRLFGCLFQSDDVLRSSNGSLRRVQNKRKCRRSTHWVWTHDCF